MHIYILIKSYNFMQKGKRTRNCMNNGDLIDIISPLLAKGFEPYLLNFFFSLFCCYFLLRWTLSFLL